MARPIPNRPPVTLYRTLFLAPYFGLIGLQVLWHAWAFPWPAVAVVLVVVPLLVPLPWLLRRSAPRAPLAAALVSLAYFVHGVTEALVLPPPRPLALAEVALCLWVFAAAPAARRAWSAH